MKLYGAALSPYVARVLLQIRRKGLDIPLVPPPDGDMKSPAYRAINPYGKMPALDAGEGCVIESEVICEYLEERFPDIPMLPSAPLDRARSRTISRAVDFYILQPLVGLFGQMNPATRDRAAVEQKLAELTKGLDGLNSLLKGPWAVAPTMMLADCALIPACFYLERFLPLFDAGDLFRRYPALEQVWTTAKADPLVTDLLAEMASSLEKFMMRRAANT